MQSLFKSRCDAILLTAGFMAGFLMLTLLSSQAQAEAPNATTQACIQEMLAQSTNNTTLGDIRSTCHQQQETLQERSEHALRTRLALENATELNPFVITPHHRNYIMPFSYWSNPAANDSSKAHDYHHLESKFQISFKVPIVDLWSNAKLYGAFTGTFFWQVYSSNISRPFRETNYMPELFVAQPTHWSFGPIKSQLLMYGFVHESNGQDVPLSRSWNRLYINYIFQAGPWYFALKPWWRIPENRKSDPLDRSGDDNPDIEHYMGHFELKVSRVFGHQVVDLLLRNNFHRDNNAGAAQLDYTFPLPFTHRFKGIVQAFTGYGDSLINYNNYENRISIGILLTDTL